MNVPSDEAGKGAGGRERAAREPEELRGRVLDAALRVFAERGFHGTAVPEIAQAARVGVGSIYRHFESKERLVNAVFRRAKSALRDALLLGLDLGSGPESAFRQVWARLVRFQREQPLAFQFLEMQDHVPYLDEESRDVERSVLAPIWMATRALHPPESADVPAEVLIALVWGAFVGLTKAQRLGYITLDDASFTRAGEVCLRALVAPTSPTPHAPAPARAPKEPLSITEPIAAPVESPRERPVTEPVTVRGAKKRRDASVEPVASARSLKKRRDASVEAVAPARSLKKHTISSKEPSHADRPRLDSASRRSRASRAKSHSGRPRRS